MANHREEIGFYIKMNNRLIKFRAYDTKNKKWLTAVPSLEYLLDDGDECVSHHDIDPESAIYSYPHNLIGDTFDDRVIWQQFTGLKDSTGKEIYEGDILKYANLNYKVMWVDWQWVATCPNYNRHHWPKFENFGRETRASKIIGNIFETPELLA